MTALTVVREEKVTVRSAPFSEILYVSVKVPGEERADLQWLVRAMTTDTRTTQAMTKAAVAMWSRGHTGAVSLLSRAQRTVLFMTKVQPQKILQIFCVQPQIIFTLTTWYVRLCVSRFHLFINYY